MFQAQSQVFAVGQVDGTIFVDIQLIPSATLGLFQVEIHFELVFRGLDARFKQFRQVDFAFFDPPTTEM